MPTGAKIKKLRIQKGLTQKQLGEKCGMYESQIRKYENGYANPKIETLQKIADALGVSLRDLLLSDDIIEVDGMPGQPINLMGYSVEEIGKALEHIQSELHPENNHIPSGDLDNQDLFLSFLEWLGYKISVIDYKEMQRLHLSLYSDDDYLIGIQDDRHDNVTFFHKKDFIEFQNEVAKTIDYEIYKQFRKSEKEPEPPRRDDPEMEL